jgi:N6-adenosine-specific RNA methylase IME4
VPEQYDVIYCDPPWWYSNRSANHITKFGGGARAHYDVMPDKDLLAMADLVKSLCADNTAMFMWATGPRLDFATELLKAWGFRYVTVGFTWIKKTKHDKIHRGPGGYTSANAEFCLIGVKGSKLPEKKLIPSVVLYPRLRHSEKPPIVRTRIEQMYPNARRIEMFARHTAEGWSAWGNEVGKLDSKDGRLAL